MKKRPAGFFIVKFNWSDVMTFTFKLVVNAILVALGIGIPIIFHMFGIMGKVFLPMHIPVLIAGLLLGSRAGSITGFLTPLLSSLLTGMPPFMPTLPAMTVELLVYGFVSGYLRHKFKLSLVIALLGAMVIGRAGSLIMLYIMALLFQIKIDPITYFSAGIITGLPGVCIQLILIPLLVSKLQTMIKRNDEK